MNAIIIKKYGENNHQHKKRPFNFAFDALVWITLARSKDCFRKVLNGIYSDGSGGFVATDGHRLHQAIIKDYIELIPKGVWEVAHCDICKIILAKPSETLQYPEYKKVTVDMPSSWNQELIRTGRVNCSKGNGDAMLWEFFSIAGKCVALRYFQDAVKGSDIMTVRTHIDGMQVIELDNCNPDYPRQAYIMPIKT